jgi:hypothetical protein
MLYNFRENQCQAIDANDVTDLRLSDADDYDNFIDLVTAITILQYPKDRYFKTINFI